MKSTCQICGYEWMAAGTKTPSRCPSCHTRKWNKNPYKGIPDKLIIKELESRGYEVWAKVGFSGDLPNGNDEKIPGEIFKDYPDEEHLSKYPKPSRIPTEKPCPEVCSKAGCNNLSHVKTLDWEKDFCKVLCLEDFGTFDRCPFADTLPNGNTPEEKPQTLLDQAISYHETLMKDFSKWLQSKFNYLMQHPDKSYPVESQYLDLFWLIDIDQGINYVDKDLKLISKTGTKLVPVKHFAIVIFNDEDIKFFYKICKQKERIYIEPVKHCPSTSRSGIVLFEQDGYRVYCHAFESEYRREGCKFNNKTLRYETKPGWVSGSDYNFNGYLEIRKPGELKGYVVLEELDKLPFGNMCLQRLEFTV